MKTKTVVLGTRHFRPLAAAGLVALPVNAEPVPCRVYDFEPLTQRLANSLGEVGPAGVGLSIIQDGRVIYQRTFGPLAPTTQLEIASATKLLSAAVIMATVDDGVLALSDTAAETGAEFEPVLRGATVAQMFSHTSGIDPDPAFNRNAGFATTAACVDAIASIPPASVPGVAVNYGGNSMQTAGHLAEIKTETPWQQLAQQQIIGPLGLAQTDYLATTNGEPTTNPNVAGSGRSTLNDFTRLVAMLSEDGRFAGESVVSPESVGEMFTTQPSIRIDHSPYERYVGLIPWAETLRTGLGCFIQPPSDQGEPPERIVSQGAWGASAYIAPARGFSMVFFVEQRERTDVTRPDGVTVSINPAFLTFADVAFIAETIIPQRRTPASLADVNKDNRVTGADFNAWLTEYARRSTLADQNRDGIVNGADFNAWLVHFNTACD